MGILVNHIWFWSTKSNIMGSITMIRDRGKSGKWRYQFLTLTRGRHKQNTLKWYNMTQAWWCKPVIHFSFCGQGFKVIFGYTESLRSAWAMWDPVAKKNRDDEWRKGIIRQIWWTREVDNEWRGAGSVCRRMTLVLQWPTKLEAHSLEKRYLTAHPFCIQLK